MGRAVRRRNFVHKFRLDNRQLNLLRGLLHGDSLLAVLLKLMDLSLIVNLLHLTGLPRLNLPDYCALLGHLVDLLKC